MSINRKMKTFVFGDIHGCFNQLNLLISELPISFDKKNKIFNDRLIFLGDYIDRGPDSKKVIEYLMNLQEKNGKDKIICLKGNHEEMMLEAIKDSSEVYYWMRNGGNTTLDSFDNGNIPKNVVEWVESLPRFFQDDENIFVHAGVNKNFSNFEEQIKAEGESHDFTWIRNEFIKNKIPWKKRVIFGHTPFKEPYVDNESNIIGIDTGIVYGNKLTCFCIEDNEFYFVYGEKNEW